MLKMRGKGIGNRELLVFAVSDENIKKLRDKDPIYFNLRQLGGDLPDVDISIAWGDDIDQIYQELQKFIREKFE